MRTMGRHAFDKKFGSALVESLPTGPGIYLFRDAERGVLYIGKAKNIRAAAAELPQCQRSQGASQDANAGA